MSGTQSERDIALARERADLARLRFGNATQDLIGAFSPDRLKARTIEAASQQFHNARHDLMRRVRHWPLAFAGGALVVGALIFWRPGRKAARLAMRVGSIAWATRNIWRPRP